MKTKKTSFIVALAIAFVAAISVSAFAGTKATEVKAADETAATVITLANRNACTLLDPANPETSRVDVSFTGNTWTSSFVTTGNVNYTGKAEDVSGNKINVDLVVGAASDGKFRVDFKFEQNDAQKFILTEDMTFTTTATGDMPKTVSFAGTNIIGYNIGGGPTISPLGILTPTKGKYSANDTSFGGYAAYCSFEYSAVGYDPKTDGNVELKGINVNLYDLNGSKSGGRMDVNFGKTGRVYLRVASDTLTQFVVKKGEVFSLSGKAFKFADTYKFTWKNGGSAEFEKFDESVWDNPEQPIAEKLIVSVGKGQWATDLNNGKVQVSAASTKEGYYKATGVYAGKAEDDKGNEVDVTVEWDANNDTKLILKFDKTVDILVLKTTMEFTLSAPVTGAPQKVSFAKDVFLTYAIGSSNVTFTDLAKLANMKTATVSLGAGSYATDSDKDKANARAFVSFLGCTWKSDEGTFTMPTEEKMDKGVKYVGGEVYDKDGTKNTTNVELVVTALPDKDRTDESTANHEFRVYIKFVKTINPVFIKAGTTFQRSGDDADGAVTPFKLVIDKDYVVTYVLESDNVRFTPHLITFEASEGMYEGSSFYAEEGERLTAPEDVTVPHGYRAVWLDEESNEFDFENTVATKNVTLHLSTIKQVTVTFDSDGGTVKNPITLDVNGKIAKPADPIKSTGNEKTKYVLTGWFVEGSDTPFDFENTAITEDITLKAKWELKTVKVTLTFDSDGGTAINPVLIDVNGKATKPEDPTKTVGNTKYTFNGWFAEGSDTPFDFENTAITEDITLTAKWTEVKAAKKGCNGSVPTVCVSFAALVAVAAVALLKKKKA